jgi:hypothetical protein
VYYEPEPRPRQRQPPLLHFVFLVRQVHPEQAPVASSPEIGDLGWWTVDALPLPISDFTERRIVDAASGRPADVGRVGHRQWRG